MKITIILPDDARHAMLRGRPWEGELTAKLRPDGKRDPSNLIFTVDNGLDDLFADEAIVVTTWNKACSGNLIGRNVPLEDIPRHTKLIQQAVAELGSKKLVALISQYFKACRAGRHRSSGRNRAYKSLDGFLRRVREAAKTGRIIWWQSTVLIDPDPHPELTMRVADAFAKRFLKRQQFGKLKQTDTAYRKFQIAGDWILKTAKKNPYGLSIDRVLVMLLDCVAEGYGSGAISPGHLSTGHTWRVLIPQYLAARFEG